MNEIISTPLAGDLNNYLATISGSITVEFVIKFIIVYFFIIWISLVVWVLKDIRNRTSNILFQFICLLIPILLTPFGIFVYILIRPSKTLYEKYYDEIEENLDIINEIIEERKKQFENKINKSLEEETKQAEKKFSKPIDISWKNKWEQKVEVKTEEPKKITQIKKKDF